MVLFPRRGKQYWYVTDIWETFVVVPVTVECQLLKWDLGNGLSETYKLTRLNLYSTQKQARHKAAELNRKGTT